MNGICMDNIISVSKAAKMLGINAEDVYHLIYNKDIISPGYNRIDKKSVEAYIARTAAKNAKKVNDNLSEVEKLRYENAQLKKALSYYKEKSAKEQYIEGLDTQENLFRLLQQRLEKDEFDLSMRALNCLHFSNIFTVGDLVGRTENELLMCRNMGRKSVSELKYFAETVLKIPLGSIDVDRFNREYLLERLGLEEEK